METLKKIGSLFVFLAAITIPAWAAQVSVTATVDRNQMRPGDTFTYTISISSEDNVQPSEPTLPDLSAFELVNAWPTRETRATFSNGVLQTLRSVRFNYQLAPRSAGSFTIGAAQISAGDQIFRTNPITIQVSDSVQAPPLSQQRQQQRQQQLPSMPPGLDDEDDLFSQLLNRRLGRFRENFDPNAAFFIHAETDKTKVYEGEQVIASWYLLTRNQIADIDTLKYPSLAGFWKEDIEVATRLNFRPEIINGLQYNKALLASYALFPIKPGKLHVDEYKAKCRIIAISAFGMPQEGEITKASEIIPIEVLPLPEGKPASFSGGVGDFQITQTLDSKDLKTNQPFTVKIRVDGRGNAKAVDLPNVKWPEGMDVYDTKTATKFFPNGQSFKEFEVLLIPRQQGTFTIPAMTFGFFDPSRKTYYEKSTQEQQITIEKGLDHDVIPSTQISATGGQNEVKKRIELPQPLFAKEDSSPTTRAQVLGTWAGTFGLGVLTLFGYGYFLFRETNRKENLRQIIKRRMQTVLDFAKAGNARAVGTETMNVIYTILGEISGMGSGGAFEIDKLIEHSPPSFKRHVAPRLQELVKKVERLAFAPESTLGEAKSRAALTALIDETESVLKEALKYDFSSPQQTKDA